MNKKLTDLLSTYSYSLVYSVAKAMLERKVDGVSGAEEARESAESISNMFFEMLKGGDAPQIRLNQVGRFANELKDAMSGTDLVPLFEDAIQRVMRMPAEPNLFLQNVVATKIQLAEGGSSLFEILNIGAFTADWVEAGGEYPMAKPSASYESAKLTARRAGIMTAIEEEAAQNATVNIASLYLGMMADAVARFKETQLKNRMDSGAAVYDNSSSDSTYHTTGVDVSGNANYTMDHRDLMNMVSILKGRRYNASHALAHPMTWLIWTQDPYMKAQFFHGGSFGTNFNGATPQFETPVPVPYGLQYVPYYASEITDGPQALTGPGSGVTAAPLATITVLDKMNALWLLEKGSTTMDSMEDWFKDGRVFKVKTYFDTATKDGGRAIITAKNVRVAYNEAPVFTVRTQS